MTATAAAAITRSLRPLTSGRLVTATVPSTGTLVGWRVTTTQLLTTQLDAAPNGHVLVKRRVAEALGLADTTRVGVSIAPDRGTIDIVAPPPLTATSPPATATSQLQLDAPDDVGLQANQDPRRHDHPERQAAGVDEPVDTLVGLARWLRDQPAAPSLACLSAAVATYRRCRPTGYRLGHQALHGPGDGPARYTIEALTTSATTHATVATFDTLADAITLLAHPALPQARRHATTAHQLATALANIIVAHNGTPTTGSGSTPQPSAAATDSADPVAEDRSGLQPSTG